MKALEDSGIACDPARVITAEGYAYADGAESVKKLIARDHSLTAVLCYFDVMALGAMRGLMELGYRVPGIICRGV
jgi:DNA-binding LacI/PurR family transcriptional regulator